MPFDIDVQDSDYRRYLIESGNLRPSPDAPPPKPKKRKRVRSKRGRK